MFECLKKGIVFDEFNAVPEKERYYLKHKIKTITNFNELVIMIKELMELATVSRLILCEDAFFFGFNNETLSIDKIIIADFDNVHYCEDDDDIKKDGNERILLSSLWEFFDNFVQDKEANIFKEEIVIIVNKLIIKID